MTTLFGFDAYAPKEIAERVENVGVAKARLPLLSTAALGVLAGGFIGLGCVYFGVVAADASLSFAVKRVLSGFVFSLGLVLVVVAGAELFTGNVLLVMACVAGRISIGELARNLGVVFAANFVGAAGLAVLVALSGQWRLADGAVGRTLVEIAAAKCALPPAEAFARGVLCNVLVCLAVWLSMAGRTVADKVLAVVLPISAFIAAGFEHSVANLYFLPMGLLLRDRFETAVPSVEALDWIGVTANLVPVTLGNVGGGAGMVGLVYWLVYRRASAAS